MVYFRHCFRDDVAIAKLCCILKTTLATNIYKNIITWYTDTSYFSLEVFMNQYKSISQIRSKLREVISSISDEKLIDDLENIDRDLDYFFRWGIDFKEVVDTLDDSIFITDSHGNVLYVNPAYSRNTKIQPEQVLGHNINDLIGTDKIYTGGAIPDVLKTKKSAFRLSTTYASGEPLMGYVAGTPLFDSDGNLHQVVACSRPIVSLKSLRADFDTFIKELQDNSPKNIEKTANEHLSSEMIGRSTTLANIWTLISHVAPSDATVLITGESGSGKEVIADEIYKNSKRSQKPFIKINCAAIPPHLLESELFGYEKGAFSGANNKGKVGLFEMANHGTLMLDEIGDMPMDLQVKLLRAIQQQEITRIGGSKVIKLDIRFLALTNSDLKEKIEKGTFRQDLYYRLNVIPIHVPPLRERTGDIEALCNHFIEIFSQKYNSPFALNERQYGYMRQYHWPGNIRELENIIEYLVLCSAGIGHVDDSIITNLLNISSQQSHTPSDTDFNTAVAQFEKQLLERTLKNSSNLREAGKKLNINASTISRKIKQYDIDYPGKKE